MVKASELLDLIPLYVTGKVTNEQRVAIEDALLQSKELQKELAFWQAARQAAKNASTHSVEAHLSSQQIVDYVVGTAEDPRKRLEIQHHLQTCASCRDDFEIAKAAFPSGDNRRTERRFQGRLTGFLWTAIRPAYSVPALAVLFVIGFLLRDNFLGPDAHPIHFALEYQSQQRSLDTGSLATLHLRRDVSAVFLSVPIPHGAIQPTRYSLTLTTPDAKQLSLVNELKWSQGTSYFDTASVSIPSAILRNEGTYSLLAVIEYAQASRPFEYSYRFRVELED